jgi:hypothetical protein
MIPTKGKIVITKLVKSSDESEATLDESNWNSSSNR